MCVIIQMLQTFIFIFVFCCFTCENTTWVFWNIFTSCNARYCDLSKANWKCGLVSYEKANDLRIPCVGWPDCNRSSNVAQISKICASRCRTWFSFLGAFCKSTNALTLGSWEGIINVFSIWSLYLWAHAWEMAPDTSQCGAAASCSCPSANGLLLISQFSVRRLPTDVCKTLSSTFIVSCV